jgi:hypothetical protein
MSQCGRTGIGSTPGPDIPGPTHRVAGRCRDAGSDADFRRKARYVRKAHSPLPPGPRSICKAAAERRLPGGIVGLPSTCRTTETASDHRFLWLRPLPSPIAHFPLLSAVATRDSGHK